MEERGLCPHLPSHMLCTPRAERVLMERVGCRENLA